MVPGTAELSVTDRAAPLGVAEAASGASGVSFRHMANAVRALAIDAVAAARSGDHGIPTGMADVATVLWSGFLKFDAADPRWPDRDRFVLSAGHGSMLLYALLHLTGHAGMGIDELRQFRQLHSPATGHPEVDEHPAIEATTGPLGQGIATAVGMALAERMMAARFGRSLIDHRIWVIACGDDLAAGISHEAIELAGRLRLEKLTVLYEEADGAALAGSTSQPRRFAAHGWAVKQVDGHDPRQVAAALSFAVRARKPTLIACRSRTGAEAGTPGRPLGVPEARLAKQAIGWDSSPFAIPDDVAERWRAAGAHGAGARRAWLKRAARHPLGREFERAVAGRLPESWHEAIAAFKAGIAETRPAVATGQASHEVLQALAPAIPELAGGSAGRLGPQSTPGRRIATVGAGNFAGRHVEFGVGAHGMAACLNGMALHGGLIAYGSTFVVFTDQLRPALRLAALMRRRVIYALTDDSIGLGEDGPTHQPVEHLASLRAMPNLHVFRPADAMETAECWEVALRRAEGPSLLILTRQAVPSLRGDTVENRSSRGGYVIAEAEGTRQVTLIATGSEVAIAMRARDALGAAGVAAAVVSLPCWELFVAQHEGYRAKVLGGVPRVGIEAACGFGWERWLGETGIFVGMTGFGASAPYETLYRHFGITPEAIVAAVRKRLG